MDSIQYIGEHLLPGQVGQLAALFGFIASSLAAVAYYFATQKRGAQEEANWLFIGRSAFVGHSLGTIGVIGVIFYIMLNQYYEYHYVWAHTSEDLPLRYIFSAFWEGQEGSFLLWMFWHVVLGMVLMLTAKRWEAPTLSVLALVQAILGSMILGLYITEDIKVGSSPLLLLRQTMDAPIFNNADYLSLVQGSGLAPALQNYWMTIHPPTLFLGFASTVVPFCFAIAGLWTQEHKAWLRPAMRWSLFSAGILGTGILMGGAWAYEALNFGGYWAWDPVENASLVPWLILIAGVHSNLIANATGHAVRTSYIFYILTFLFVLYSTFLTRSGVLGETSVHAFTQMGLETQLIILMSVFGLLGGGLFLYRNKGIPTPVKEEATPSREFWMFIGTLVLLFSSVLITGSTSLPIYNKIRQAFDPMFDGIVIEDANTHYNKYQLWIAVFIASLSGVSQYLRYREVNFKKYLKKFGVHMSVAFALTALATYLLSLWINLHAWQYTVLLATCVFSIVTNLDYFITFTKGNLKAAGSALSHAGFAVMIIGVLASSLNKTVISSDP
ncbi:MAG: cytochrome c biogenesis protein CcsA, partial [Bacteroidota bacterium]